jgi:hypothetical protein
MGIARNSAWGRTMNVRNVLPHSFDGYLTARADLHFQFEPFQERHANQWVRIGFVYKHTASFAVPLLQFPALGHEVL